MIQRYTIYNGATYSRTLDGTSWGNWSRVDNFGCKTESELASLLGGVTVTIPNNTDLDTLQTIGVTYNCPGGSITATLLHRPSDLTEAFTMYVLAGIRTQIIITTWGGFKLYKRTYDTGNNSWYKWQKVTGTEVEYAT